MIRNTTRGIVLAKEIETASSFWGKARGLMFRSALPPGQGLLLDFGKPARTGIWMFGMRFPLDLVFINNNRVVDLKERVRPLGLDPATWRVFYPRVPARFCLELPAGTIKKTGTTVSDSLLIK